MESQEVQMQTRLEQMPSGLRSLYKKAMRGKSLKSAVQSFCFECVAWQRKEVKLCTDLGCPLYLYRPCQKTPWKAFKAPLERSKKQREYYKRLSELKKSAQPTLFPPDG